MANITFNPINQYSQSDINAAQQPYDQDTTAANTANQNLQQFQQGMQSGQDIYNNQLQQAQSAYGFNPADLLKANQTLATTQTTLANLPKAIQAQGGGYGTTAGAEANNYSQQAGNLQAVLAGQGNAVNAYQSTLAATQNQAGQATTAEQAGYGQQITALQNIYSNAADQQKTALSQLQNLQALYQKQGQFNADEVAQYQQANAAMQSAQAAMASAGAQMVAAQAAKETADQTVSQNNNINAAYQKLYGADYGVAESILNSGGTQATVDAVMGRNQPGYVAPTTTLSANVKDPTSVGILQRLEQYAPQVARTVTGGIL